MTDLLNAPIPGQSLTDEPKNYPWERPPEITDPREAIKFHVDGLTEPKAIDNIIELLQIGMPVATLAKTALTTAQMEGIHTVDVSLIIKDVIQEEIASIAEEAGIDYLMGDEPDETELKEKEEQQILALIRKRLKSVEPGSEEDDSGVEFMRQSADMLVAPDDKVEEPMDSEAPVDMTQDVMIQEDEEIPMMDAPEEEEEAPRGLMARG